MLLYNTLSVTFEWAITSILNEDELLKHTQYFAHRRTSFTGHAYWVIFKSMSPQQEKNKSGKNLCKDKNARIRITYRSGHWWHVMLILSTECHGIFINKTVDQRRNRRKHLKTSGTADSRITWCPCHSQGVERLIVTEAWMKVVRADARDVYLRKYYNHVEKWHLKYLRKIIK